VCINPQALNDLTRGNYPRKVDEYLALGKPVVATRTPAMEEFAQVTYLASSAGEFAEQVKRALAENTPALEEERELFASTHSWEKNAGIIGDMMDLVMHGGKIHPGKEGKSELNQTV
jgi:glycosyltransferase involved in cell wall biosynthesis